jgi:hypothetical protein
VLLVEPHDEDPDEYGLVPRFPALAENTLADSTL